MTEIHGKPTLCRESLSVSPKACASCKIADMFRVYRKAGESGSHQMESDIRFYARRLAQEQVAARNALTVEARARRLALAAKFEAKLALLSA